jgi:hypothetical protein
MNLKKRIYASAVSMSLAAVATVGIAASADAAVIAYDEVGTPSLRVCQSIRAEYVADSWSVIINCKNYGTKANPWYRLKVVKWV